LVVDRAEVILVGYDLTVAVKKQDIRPLRMRHVETTTHRDVVGYRDEHVLRRTRGCLPGIRLPGMEKKGENFGTVKG